MTLSGHAPDFLSTYESKIPEWVRFVVSGNRAEGILSILTKTHTSDASDPLHPLNLARQIRCPTLLISESLPMAALVDDWLAYQLA